MKYMGSKTRIVKHIYYHYAKGSNPLKPLPATNFRYIEEHEYDSAKATVQKFAVDSFQKEGK